MMKRDKLSEVVIGAAIEVHRELGPGLLESAYERCLEWELESHELDFDRQRKLPISYKDEVFDCGYRLDLFVENRLIVELKSVREVNSLHQAQTISYLRQSEAELALLINFNVELLKDGIHRYIV